MNMPQNHGGIALCMVGWPWTSSVDSLDGSWQCELTVSVWRKWQLWSVLFKKVDRNYVGKIAEFVRAHYWLQKQLGRSSNRVLTTKGNALSRALILHRVRKQFFSKLFFLIPKMPFMYYRPPRAAYFLVHVASCPLSHSHRYTFP